MEIITLTGINSCGKSLTLNIVYQYLLFFDYTQVPGHYRSLGNAKNYDFTDILENEGKRIGIATMGDFEHTHTGDTVQDLITYLQANGCHKAICACNKGLNKAISFINTYNNTFIEKTLAINATDERIINGQDAEQIYQLI